MTVAEVVAAAIAADAADRVFAFPGGGTNLDVMEALAARDVPIVLARSEGGAAFMAATYADLTGRPAALLVGLGPGVSNAVNGVAHAFLDQSPLLVLSDRFGADELGTSGHQLLDQRGLLRPVTKWQETLTPANAGAATARALAVAATPPAGPVQLELPHDAAGADAAPAPTVRTELGRGSVPPEAVDAVAAARRPVLLVGDEAAHAPLVALAERLGAPVLTSYKGKGAFPEDHPLWCGIVTNAAVEAPLLAAADLLVAVGLDPVELLPRPWTGPAPILALRAHEEPARGYAPRWQAVGDVAALADELRGSRSTWTAPEIEERRTATLERLRIPADGSLSAVEVVEAVQAATPSKTTVTVDAGAHMFAATWFWRSQLPRRFLISNGLATMGYAVPAAVAAALARPGEPVVAFTGDGGFLLHGAELETAARLGARVIVVVLNDSSLSLIRIKQEDRRLRRLGVDFSQASAAGVGIALGARGVRVARADELRTAVASALTHEESTVVEVAIGGSEYGDLQRAIRG